MIAEVTRFYGGSPLAWLDVPVTMLRALYERIPMLAAREQLRAVRVAILGTGHLKPADQSKEIRSLRTEAGYSAAPRRRATIANIRALGIGVKVVRK